MASDLEIANATTLEPIEAIAWKLGISSTELMPMGRGVAKITPGGSKAEVFKATRKFSFGDICQSYSIW